MTAFARRVAALMGVAEERLERLAGGDLSEVLMLRRSDGRCTVAKGGPAVGTEATMLRMLAGAGLPTPAVEGEHQGVLLLQYVPNDGVFSPHAWSDVGRFVRELHNKEGDRFGWPVDYSLGTVEMDNRETARWPTFWAERRLIGPVQLLDRPWRERVSRLALQMDDLLPASPKPSLLHGDLWSGNILVEGGKLAALIDPACYYGHHEVDLAMLSLFGEPPASFWESYGEPDDGWEKRRDVYQLYPALVHLRLFGASYGRLVDRLLSRLGV